MMYFMTMWTESKKPIIALAPMADMTDGPFCRVCRETAGDDFVIFREMASAEAIVRNNEKTLRMCGFEAVERPVILQIFGGEAGRLALAARIIYDKFRPDGIDVNMGCPVPKITGKIAAGATLMKNPDKAAGIVRAIKAEKLPIPVTVKTRLGWSDPREILSFAPLLEQAGADGISIHGRTKTQGYAGKADWEIIGTVKKMLTIPVIANGDIGSREDIERCLQVTGADGVMLGRGALGNPWIFSSASLKDFNFDELARVVLRHAHLHLEHYGPKSMVTFRKHLAWYFRGDRTKDISGIKKTRGALMQISSVDELEKILQKIR
jgi:tRNA-dihydrouridine synthase B